MPDIIIRPNWDEYFMAIARITATRSTCDRLHTGAVLVLNKRIVATGYNGSPPGLPHCDDVGHLLEEGHCVRTIHAEHNVLLQSAVLGISIKDATLYTLYTPCIHCAKYIAACGIKRVVFVINYRNSQTPAYLKEAGIQVDQFKENPDWLNYLSAMFKNETKEVKAEEGDVNFKISV